MSEQAADKVQTALDRVAVDDEEVCQTCDEPESDCKCVDWDEDDYGDWLYERWKDKRDD
jgi:hypothetical protein